MATTPPFSQVQFFLAVVLFFVSLIVAIGTRLFFIVSRDGKRKSELQPWLLLASGGTFTLAGGVLHPVLLLVIGLPVGFFCLLLLESRKFCGTCGTEVFKRGEDLPLPFCKRCGGRNVGEELVRPQTLKRIGSADPRRKLMLLRWLWAGAAGLFVVLVEVAEHFRGRGSMLLITIPGMLLVFLVNIWGMHVCRVCGASFFGEFGRFRFCGRCGAAQQDG